MIIKLVSFNVSTSSQRPTASRISNFYTDKIIFQKFGAWSYTIAAMIWYLLMMVVLLSLTLSASQNNAEGEPLRNCGFKSVSVSIRRSHLIVSDFQERFRGL